VETASAVDQAQASAAIAVYAAESADSLRVELARVRIRLSVLESATGGDRLAEARQSMARPHARKTAKSFWRFW